MMIKTTLREILDQNPCADGWNKLLFKKGLADKNNSDELSKCPKSELDKEFPLSDILETNDVPDTLWAVRRVVLGSPEKIKLTRKFSVWCARRVENLMTDSRSKHALDVAWRYSDGLATDDELEKAIRGSTAAFAPPFYTDTSATSATSADSFNFSTSVYSDDAAYNDAIQKQSAKLKQILDAGEWVDD